MRILRIGEPATRAGEDARAALASWGSGRLVRGGIALIGVQPPGCTEPVDAVVLLPRGVLVVVGVDLPDPAKRLDAPVRGAWHADGRPLHNGAGAAAGAAEASGTNPATAALRTASAAVRALQRDLGTPLSACVAVAVGPYVGEAVQPPGDLARGVRVLHPGSATLRAAVDQLDGVPFEEGQLRAALGRLVPHQLPEPDGTLREEGFIPATNGAAATDDTGNGGRLAALRRFRPRWLPAVGGGLVLVCAAVTALVAGTGTRSPAAPEAASGHTTAAGPAGLHRQGLATGTDCAASAYGDVQTWLRRTGCAGLTRTVLSGTANGRDAAVALSVVRFPDAATAARFRDQMDVPGAGGITALPGSGAARSFDDAAFRSSLRRLDAGGGEVRVARAVYAHNPSDATDPALGALAERALRARLPR